MTLITTADEAVSRIKDGQTIAVGGASGFAVPEKLLEALGNRFRETGRPRDLTLVHVFGVGNQKGKGLDHLAQPGLFRRVIGGHWSMAPGMARLAAENEFEAYNLPAGVMEHLYGAAAAGRPGLTTPIGLHTFVDPRLEGGKLNERATEDLVELATHNGEEYLFYQTVPIDVALIHASEADPAGNLGMNREAGFWHNTPLAMAARASGGTTLAVTRHLVEPGAIHPRDVRVPGSFVDAVVVDPDHGQHYDVDFDSTFTGDAVKPEDEFGDFPLSLRKVIARRAALELAPGAVLNVGFGVADGVMKVAREQGLAATLTPTIEHGQFGGIPAEGLLFGAMYNASAMLESPHMFTLYHGRGVDQAYLGFLQIDREGNVNVSKLRSAIIGTGGFIDIAQRARKLVFCGSLAVRAETELTSDGVRFLKHGRPKLVEKVDQVTFSGRFARRSGQQVLYVTEAAVFQLADSGVQLIEIAAGLDFERDIIPQLGFRPAVSDSLRTMPPELFSADLLPRRLFRHYEE